MAREDLLRRVEQYAQRNGFALGEQLGFGMHGIVIAAKTQTQSERLALKVHEREKEYRRECDVYRRLELNAVRNIHGCHVPTLIACDDELWVIAMTLVSRPFVLDFAGAYLDFAPDFSDEVMDDSRAEKLEQFGNRWNDVQAILGELESYGILMLDVNPGNISFGD